MENREGEDNEIFQGVWNVVETKAGEVGIAEAKGGRREGGSRKKMRKKGKEAEKTKERQKNRSIKDSRGVGNLGQRRECSKVRSRDKKVSTGEVL